MTELTDGVVVLRSRRNRAGTHLFTVGHDTTDVGSVCLTEQPDGRGILTWELAPDFTGHGYATRAVRLLIDYAFRAARLERVEALVDTANERAMRVATRSGLRREGVLRGHGATDDGREDKAVFARLATDPPTTEAAGFRALLNSFLPRKRAIAQMLVRDNDGRVLLCRLTYKNDFDLPGGVVEVGESPQVAVAREVEEELGFDIKAGALLVTDWLPPWGGWDDALCLVFDGGVADASVLDEAVLQAREIRSAQFCTLAEVRETCADFTARRIEAAMRTLEGGGTAYTESGRA
jgi:8-oxo-dGTP pyrophosphatase MutT (NUDIX family)